MLVFIRKLSLSTLSWLPIYKGFIHFFLFFASFRIGQITHTSIRARLGPSSLIYGYPIGKNRGPTLFSDCSKLTTGQFFDESNWVLSFHLHIIYYPPLIPLPSFYLFCFYKVDANPNIPKWNWQGYTVSWHVRPWPIYWFVCAAAQKTWQFKRYLPGDGIFSKKDFLGLLILTNNSSSNNSRIHASFPNYFHRYRGIKHWIHVDIVYTVQQSSRFMLL